LRDEILSGGMAEVPRLEDLVARFNVGPPAVREAMRILETEGLITVRRGNVGGADVFPPTEGRVAYMVSLVLQSKAARLADVGAALRELEPRCAALCARRADRHKTIVPELKKIVAEQAQLIGDRTRTMEVTDRFHEVLVQRCGNETLIVVVGALERVWASHASAVYRDDPVEPSAETWTASLREHERIVGAIEKGDPKVAQFVEKHLAATHAYMSSVDNRRTVAAKTLRQ